MFSESFCKTAFVCDTCRDRWEARRSQPKPGNQLLYREFKRAINLPYNDD